jgi:hypothetical protein
MESGGLTLFLQLPAQTYRGSLPKVSAFEESPKLLEPAETDMRQSKLKEHPIEIFQRLEHDWFRKFPNAAWGRTGARSREDRIRGAPCRLVRAFHSREVSVRLDVVRG